MYTPKVSQSWKDADAERRLHITPRFANTGPTNAQKKVVKIEKPFALALCNSINFTFYKSQNLLNPDYYVIIFNDLFFFLLHISPLFFRGAHWLHIDWFVFIQLDCEIYSKKYRAARHMNVQMYQKPNGDVVFLDYSIFRDI